MKERYYTKIFIFGLIFGPFLMLLTFIFEPRDAMSADAWHVAGLTGLMAVWWVFRIIPIPITALLPIVFAPRLGLSSIETVTAPYADPIIYLFLGGFMLGIALQRWNLHRRIALVALLSVGNNQQYQVGAMLLVSAVLSMWMSNTATAILLLPIGLSIINLVTAHDKYTPYADTFTYAMLLAIAYGASIGGVATIIGSPPNALLVGFLHTTYDIQIGFFEWMIIGLPVSVVMLIITWIWLTRIGLKVKVIAGTTDTQELIYQQLAKLGPLSRGEKTIAIIFLLCALAWIIRPILNDIFSGLNLTDTGIAITAAVLLFLIPVNCAKGDCVLTWNEAKKLPWDILLLFGGGLSLAGLITSTGLADWVAMYMQGVIQLPSCYLLLWLWY